MKDNKIYALTTYYSFDADMPVWLFKTYEEACAELKRQFEEELDIQTGENGHVQGEDLEIIYNEYDWDFASIYINTEYGKDVMEWNVSEVRADKGIGSEIPIPAKDGFMNPPVYDDTDLQKDINTFVKAMEEKYGCIEKSSSLSSIMYDFINGSLVAYKVWNRDDIASEITSSEAHDNIDDIVNEAINHLNTDGSIDVLEDCTEEEWSAIRGAVLKAIQTVNSKS